MASVVPSMTTMLTSGATFVSEFDTLIILVAGFGIGWAVLRYISGAVRHAGN